MGFEVNASIVCRIERGTCGGQSARYELVAARVSQSRVRGKSWLQAAGTADTGQNARLSGHVISFESVFRAFN
jgi:hypothetical protein